MQVVIMPVKSGLSQHAVLEAVKLAREKAGVKAVKFVELQFAPDSEELNTATDVAIRLLNTGFGIKLSVFWDFLGTKKWAIQTENIRVVNEG